MIHGIQNENYLLRVMNFKVDIGSTQHIISPKYLIGAFQTEARIGTPNKKNNLAIFNYVNVRKYFCEIDGYRYPKDAVLTNFPENDDLDQYRDLKLLYKKHVGEELLNPFKPYPNVKNEYPNQLINLRFHLDQITPKKSQRFEEFNTAPLNANARLFFLVRHRQIEMLSVGNKIIEVKVI